MPRPEDERVTALLHAWRDGEASALDDLMVAVYEPLRRIATGRLRGERERHTLQPTALVHEAFLRLVELKQIDWQDRLHFLAMASTVMRRILVEHARARRRRKRDGVHVVLDESTAITTGVSIDLLALHDALARMEADYPTEAQVVHLRFFAGMSIDETATHLGLGHSTVERGWGFARAWLFRELSRA